MKKTFWSLLMLAAAGVSPAADYTWQGYPGAAPEPPAVEQKADSVLIKAVADGGYQGAVMKFAAPVAMSDYGKIRFRFRHNLSNGKIALVIRMEQTSGAVHTVKVLSGKEWQTVTVDLNPADFQTGNGRPAVFSRVSEIRFFPQNSLRSAGLFMEFAEVQLIAKSAADEAEAQPAAPAPAKAASGGNITWDGYPGAAAVPPEAKPLTDEVAGDFVRVEAQTDGRYQGALLKFPVPVDLSAYSAMEFTFRQNFTGSKLGLMVRFEQKAGMVYTGAVLPSSREWCKVVVPFDAAKFTAQGGKTVTFAECHEIRISPYDALNAPGRAMDFAGVRFIPKSKQQ